VDLPAAGLSPPRFASGFTFVMATGIVSVGARMLGVPDVDVVLFALNVAAFAVLCAVTGLELVRCPAALVHELTDHRRGVRFLAIVAATCVLGAQVLMIGGSVPIATAGRRLAVGRRGAAVDRRADRAALGPLASAAAP
jgi:hypothetical protein